MSEENVETFNKVMSYLKIAERQIIGAQEKHEERQKKHEERQKKYEEDKNPMREGLDELLALIESIPET